MSQPADKSLRRLAPVLVCASTGFWLFHFFGNATRGYLKTSSLFFWWARQWFDPASETEHGPLIMLVSAGLFVRNLRATPDVLERPRETPWFAATLLVVGLGLHGLGYAVQQTRLSIVASLVFTGGLLIFYGGRRWGGAAFFPLGFLLLAIPVNFLDSLGYYLRLGVVETVAPLVRALGVEVIRSGTQLFAPDGHYQYEVAAACSGVRSLVALLALALLLGYLELRSFLGRVLLVALSVPVIFAGNVVRIAAIVLTGEKAGRASGESLHSWSGYLVFLIVLGLLVIAVRWLKRLSAEAKGQSTLNVLREESRLPAKTGWARPARPRRAIDATVVLTVILVAIGVSWTTRKLDSLPLRSLAGIRLSTKGGDPADLPVFLGTEWIGQRAEVTAAEREILPADTGYSRRNYVSLSAPERPVFFSIVLSGRDRSSIHRPELCLGGQGWTIQERLRHVFMEGERAPLPATVLRIEREVLDAPGHRRTVPSVLAYWFVGGDETVSTHGEMLWRGTVDRLTRFRADRWAYVVMQTPLDEHGGLSTSLARLQEVLAAVWPMVRTEGPP